jgi:DNA gyrase subunit A
MTDMDKETVDFVPNYDETRTEPTVFPAAFPNLLVNGGTGIAVGMATNIPPHNLGEVIDGICAQIDDPDITIEGLMKHVKGPDFPTGCAICGVAGVRQYIETGRGSMKVRGKAGVEELKGHREQIVITEIPYNVNRATLVERIAALVNDKVLTDITDSRRVDENMRVVIELACIPKVVINNLYKHTAMESSFAVNADRHGKPKLSLKGSEPNIEHRREVAAGRATNTRPKSAETPRRFIALANLDEFIRIIRGSANREEARVKLLAFEFTRRQVEQIGVLIRNEARLAEGRYAFSEHQTNQILELRLYQLTGLEREKIISEYKELIETIKDLRDILAKEFRVFQIVKKELREIQQKYAGPRLTQLVPDEGEINMEDHRQWKERSSASRTAASSSARR